VTLTTTVPRFDEDIEAPALTDGVLGIVDAAALAACSTSISSSSSSSSVAVVTDIIRDERIVIAVDRFIG